MDLSHGTGGWPASNDKPVWPGQNPTSNDQWPMKGGNGPNWPDVPKGSAWPGPGTTQGFGGSQITGPGFGGFPSGGTTFDPQYPGSGLAPQVPVPQFGPTSQKGAVPYTEKIKGSDRMNLQIKGVVNDMPDRFSVDLLSGNDVALHINPRFKEEGGCVIVRNSRIDGKWGKEERECHSFPFCKGKKFRMEISCTKNCYNVKVDNQHLFDYKHRIDPKKITEVLIQKDLTSCDVSVQ